MSIYTCSSGKPVLSCLPPKVERGVRITALVVGVLTAVGGVLALLSHMGVLPANFLSALELGGSLSLIVGGAALILTSILLTYCKGKQEDKEVEPIEEKDTKTTLQEELESLYSQRKTLSKERKKLQETAQIKEKNIEINRNGAEILKKLAELRNLYLDLGDKEKAVELEEKASRLINLEREARAHKNLPANDPSLVELDGIISGSNQAPSYSYEETTFTQTGGLHQVKAQNHLCGYYALYFMLCAIQEESFSNRAHFKPILNEWIKLIKRKRILARLAARRDLKLDFIDTSPVKVGGLSNCDFSYLIEKSKYLAPLREAGGCFLLELDARRGHEEENRDLVEHGGDPVGKESYLRHLGKEGNATYPLYFIVKGADDMHYSLFYATEAKKFTVVHSLGYPIDDTNDFPQESFVDLLDVIKDDILPA